MKTEINCLLAKGEKNGKTILMDHIKHVVCAIEKISIQMNLDTTVARKGAVLHDIGKAHPYFQRKLVEDKFDLIEQKTEIPLRHEISSLLFLPAFPKKEWTYLIEMIVGHHKSIKSLMQETNGKGIIDLVEGYGDNEVFERHSENWSEWSQIALKVINEFGYECNKISIEAAKDAFNYVVEFCERTELGWSRWRGLLIAADHLASALIENTIERAERIFKNPNISFFTNDSRKNDLYPLSVINTNDDRQHTLVTAPTGAGKTDFLIKRCKGRIFYILPFQASINAMYKRIKDACPNDDVRLLHASSKLLVNTSNQVKEEKVLQSLVGASIKVLTPFQLASIALGTKGFEATAIDLMNNDVILDEIHCYNDTAMGLVYEVIKMLLKLNCRIHIGTATMPKVLQNMVYELLGSERNVYKIELSKSDLKTYNRHIIHKLENIERLVDILNNSLIQNEKILIVVNQVNRAQEMFDKILEVFPAVPSMLLHSRFKRKDRVILEDKIENKFDVGGGPSIVVSTQVVEVSLDISFDMMITEAAPLDSLIQRFGRINRKRNNETIGQLKHIHVIKPSDNKNESRPYNYELIMDSFNVLPDDNILEETEIQGMLNKVYPTVDIASIKSHSILGENGFRIPMLCDYPKSVLFETLEIESASCIVESDQDIYIKARGEEKALYEIPITIRSTYRKNFQSIGRIECGSWPFIIRDELYDNNKGMLFKEVSNFL